MAQYPNYTCNVPATRCSLLQFLRVLLQAASDLVRDSFEIPSGIVRVSLGEPRRKPKESRTKPESVCHEVRSGVEESTSVNSMRLICVSNILLRYRKPLACHLEGEPKWGKIIDSRVFYIDIELIVADR